MALTDSEKAVAKKIGDDFIAALPGLLTAEVSRLPAPFGTYAAGIVTLILPTVAPSIAAWFDSFIAAA